MLQVPGHKLYRHSAWLKLVALRAMLPRYQYVLWLDSDTFVRPPGTPDLAQMLVQDGRLGAQQEDKFMAVTEEDPRFPDVANTGMLYPSICLSIRFPRHTIAGLVHNLMAVLLLCLCEDFPAIVTGWMLCLCRRDDAA